MTSLLSGLNLQRFITIGQYAPREKDYEEEDVVVVKGEISDKITGFAQDTAAVVIPPDFLLTFQTIRRVKSDEVSDITRQLQRMEEFQDLQE
ncbi:hypothetical protein Pmani_000220 [Petrolisthes manimaculis]|uniref:Uncharacterized protein n=1 Tax=Petrolisthes manimaculis TaxID=1843537 RepID=A0AAE1ULI9_9EUCA|nr:hypothetical protein Pmani_000220 [Petrolisthes manimaculis]